MNCIPLAASLMEARHDPGEIVRITREAIAAEERPEDLMTDLVLMLVGIVHTAGHNSPRVNMLLDLFAAVPAAIGESAVDFRLVRAEDIEDAHDVDQLFASMTEGTNPFGRQWRTQALGAMIAIALEGVGFEPRYLVVVGTTLAEADRLRDDLASRERR